MTDVVVGASVGVTWLLADVHWEAARRVLAPAYTRLAPDLSWPEVGNALWKRWCRGDIELATARDLLDDFGRIALTILDTTGLTARALVIAQETGRTVYDCLCLALAEAHGRRFVTADERFYNALQGTAYAGPLLWVEDVA